MADTVSPRLARVLTYAHDRADYLDIRQDVAATFVAAPEAGAISFEDADALADRALDTARRSMVRAMTRRLDDPSVRAAFAEAFVGLVLP